VGRRDLIGFTFGAPGLAHGLCVVSERQDDLGLNPSTRQPKTRNWWEVTYLKSFAARTPRSVLASEIKGLYSAYAVDDPKRFHAVRIDRGGNSGIIRGFRHALQGSDIGLIGKSITEEETAADGSIKREDLLFELRAAVDENRLKVPDSIGDEWILQLDSAVRWGATDHDVLGRSVALAFWTTGLNEVGERREYIV
jgi:hypothetical protein